MIINLKTIKVGNNNQPQYSLNLIQELDSEFNTLPLDAKTQVRKQIDIFKKVIDNLQNNQSIDTVIYQLKIAILKFSYQVVRVAESAKVKADKQKKNELGDKYSIKKWEDQETLKLKNLVLKYKNFIIEKTNDLISDLESIKNISESDRYIKIIKKVYKDFLNAIIIKSYCSK
ncbi:MAG: hypothetical protein KatS3mg092_0234 [Patescibacteria group bacterium]|nr:MAG: hypothetical protein KatS3mg092_0234 [Patescibacteria group bacterium]